MPLASEYKGGMFMKTELTLYQMLEQSVVKYPNRHALLFRGKYLTYEALLQKIDYLASGLLEIGLKKEDTITFALPNVFEAVFGFYASSKIGLRCHMVHPMTPAKQMAKHMKETKSQTLVILDTFYNHYQELLNDESISIYLVNPMTEFSGLMKYIYKVINRQKLKDIYKNERVKDFSCLYLRKVTHISNINPNSTATYLHSGGTSGKPKTIELSHHSINYLASQMDYILNKDDYEDTHMLAVLPMFHGFGLCMGIHGMLLLGGVDTLMPKFDPKDAVKKISKNQINIIIGVPSLFESLLKQPGFDSTKMANIQQAFVGGDYVAMDLKRRFNAQMIKNHSQAELLEGYGLTEVVTVCSVNTLKAHNPESVGQALPGIDMCIKDLTSDKILASNEAGEILVSGPSRMIGYLNDKEATKQAFFIYDNKTWVKTGDLGFIDDAGYVHYKQRLKRIIKVSGMPVLPAEIENLMMNYDQISEVCAVSMPDENKGHAIKLFVVWKDKQKQMTFDEIKQIIKENLGIYARPQEIVVLDELPKTIIGKTDVIALEKM